MYKKLLITAVIATSLAGCQGNSNSGTTPPAATTTTAAPTTTPMTTPAPTTAPATSSMPAAPNDMQASSTMNNMNNTMQTPDQGNATMGGTTPPANNTAPNAMASTDNTMAPTTPTTPSATPAPGTPDQTMGSNMGNNNMMPNDQAAPGATPAPSMDQGMNQNPSNTMASSGASANPPAMQAEPTQSPSGMTTQDNTTTGTSNQNKF